VTERSAGADNSTNHEGNRNAARLSRLYLDALRADDAPSAYRIAAGALQEGITIPALYQQVIAPAMHEIGVLWERGAITVADEHLATALTHRVLAALRPPIRAETRANGLDRAGGRVMLAAVEGEQHALGLRMAADVLEDRGFRTIYLGADVPTEALLRAVASLSPDVLALSATMPESAPTMERVAGEARSAHPRLSLLLGGQAAPPDVKGAGTLIQDLEMLPGELVRGSQTG
jgi:MerR family transcriptional regulator, light-induced transcriptional regulator